MVPWNGHMDRGTSNLAYLFDIPRKLGPSISGVYQYLVLLCSCLLVFSLLYFLRVPKFIWLDHATNVKPRNADAVGEAEYKLFLL